MSLHRSRLTLFPYTTLFRSPGSNSSLTNLNGPEPTISVTCSNGSVLANRSGMMNGARLETLAMASINRGNGSFNLIEKYFRSEEHTSELQSHHDLVCRLLLE